VTAACGFISVAVVGLEQELPRAQKARRGRRGTASPSATTRISVAPPGSDVSGLRDVLGRRSPTHQEART